MSKWFNQYCKLNRHDQDIICDRIVRITGAAYIYSSVVYEIPLNMHQVERLILIFRQDKQTKDIQRLLVKLERLRSQS